MYSSLAIVSFMLLLRQQLCVKEDSTTPFAYSDDASGQSPLQTGSSFQ